MKPTVPISRFWPLLAIVALFAFLAPRSAKLGYDYKKGGTWNYDNLFAPFDFPILKTPAQMQEEIDRVSSVRVPYYSYNSSVVRDRLKTVDRMDLGELKPLIVSAVRFIMEKGVLSDDAELDNSQVLCIQKDKRAVKVPSTEVFRLSDARSELLRRIQERTDSDSVDSLLLANLVYDCIVPDLTFDPDATRAQNDDAISRISPTMGNVSAGQLIVSRGDILTAETVQILDSYKREYESNIGHTGPAYLSVAGNILFAIILVSLLWFVLFFGNPTVFSDNRFYYIAFIFTLAVSAILVVSRINSGWLFIAPLTLVALYLQSFVRPRLIVPVFILSLLPLLLYADHGVSLFIIFLFGGVVSIFCFKSFGRGWKQFLLALITFAAMAVVYLALWLIGLESGTMLADLFRLFVAAFLVIALYPLIYLFEKVFNLVSDWRLSELADTSSPLLRELESKAPGTFQHSLQVMNMADAAARAIDANPLLLRVGALYHDIGKLSNPQCFIENESLLHKTEEQKYHTGLSPMQSAEDIIKHVTDGVEMAQKYHLPSIIIDFIRTHHGNSVTGYFWGKYISQKNADPSQKSRFTYPGPAPVSKEQVVLMLCDSIEAASRTLSEYTPEAISAFVERIVQGKMDEGQFAGADISIKELGEAKEALKAYLAQSHHGRVVYPQQRKKFLNFK